MTRASSFSLSLFSVIIIPINLNERIHALMRYENRNISIKGGNGGNGRASFASGRKGYVGRPDGGVGGAGGAVIAIASEDEWWLSQLDGLNEVEGEAGSSGGRNDKIGRAGRARAINVPVGTEVWSRNGDEWELLGDLVEHGQEILLARGGQPGRGNRAFATAENQAPMLAEAGGQGDVVEVSLVVKRVVDIALIGPPNSGKSTLLNALSNAGSPVGAHPFSTREAVVGVVEWKGQKLTVIDLPPLVKGAHGGRGLGTSFLRHAERARLIAYVLDGEANEWNGQYRTLLGELEAYSPALAAKPSVILVNKNDLEREEGAVGSELGTGKGSSSVQAIAISAKDGNGIEGALDAATDVIPFAERKRPKWTKGTMKKSVIAPRLPGRLVEIRKVDAEFDVVNEGIERIANGSNLNDWHARVQFHRLLDKKGILKLLEQQGARRGDIVRIGTAVLEWS